MLTFSQYLCLLKNFNICISFKVYFSKTSAWSKLHVAQLRFVIRIAHFSPLWLQFSAHQTFFTVKLFKFCLWKVKGLGCKHKTVHRVYVPSRALFCHDNLSLAQWEHIVHFNAFFTLWRNWEMFIYFLIQIWSILLSTPIQEIFGCMVCIKKRNYDRLNSELLLTTSVFGVCKIIDRSFFLFKNT